MPVFNRASDPLARQTIAQNMAETTEEGAVESAEGITERAVLLGETAETGLTAAEVGVCAATVGLFGVGVAMASAFNRYGRPYRVIQPQHDVETGDDGP